ncbi:hypothetical protein K490DRAFT_50253 [Saccharata proteae CBS 121410]|uniref:F-box domain-containing protein n=1 Tax=Saccharata proteae CBS 121410 TaxID=1314787 RepID=A0A9P4HNU9_9PEZI|nr:hypothetical protein K490DRAFT_50253 [Saccharata proteae CBS 121410]
MADPPPSSLTELPLDILLLVTPYLDVRSFLRLCSTCTALQQPAIRSDAAYWNHVTRNTFRVPNQPVVQTDAQRWERLYKRMLTQSRVYTWGSDRYQCLGHRGSYDPQRTVRTANPRFLQHNRPYSRHRESPNANTPQEMERTRDLGVIADLQCGGWSTTLLTANGRLLTAGVLKDLTITRMGPGRGLQPLTFPPGSAEEDPSVSIKQFSSGRSHVLGLSDSGRIWSWSDETKPAWHIKFLHVDISESRSTVTLESKLNRVRKVVAGWSVSSAYISGTGILLWRPPQRSRSDEREDTALITESIIVPFTNYQRPQGNAREPDESTQILGEKVGVVVNYIVLEHFVVFVTDIGRVFAARMTWEDEVGSASDVIELTSLRANATQGKNAKIDVQGSFRSWAAFRDGEVITSTQDYLEECWNARQLNGLNLGVENSQGLRRIPALQQSGVISIAFGDYHFHALHSSGHITSYGREPRSSGCLGLGPFPHYRGVRASGVGADGDLVRHAYTCGRRIWFEDVKQRWISFMASGGRDTEEAGERMRMALTDYNVQGEISEWFEQEGKFWDRTSELRDSDDDGLGAYFALSVTAAGWHSGALVLVNEDLAQRIYHVSWINDSFPRLRLSDGREMPGEVEFSEWREGAPEWDLNFDH